MEIGKFLHIAVFILAVFIYFPPPPRSGGNRHDRGTKYRGPKGRVLRRVGFRGPKCPAGRDWGFWGGAASPVPTS